MRIIDSLIGTCLSVIIILWECIAVRERESYLINLTVRGKYKLFYVWWTKVTVYVVFLKAQEVKITVDF